MGNVISGGSKNRHPIRDHGLAAWPSSDDDISQAAGGLSSTDTSGSTNESAGDPLPLDLGKLTFKIDPDAFKHFISHHSSHFQIEPFEGWQPLPLTKALAHAYVGFSRDGLKETYSTPPKLLEAILSVHAFNERQRSNPGSTTEGVFFPSADVLAKFASFPVSNALIRYIDHIKDVDPYFINKLLDCGVKDMAVYVDALEKGVKPNQYTLRKVVIAGMTGLVGPMLKKLKELAVESVCPLHVAPSLSLPSGQTYGPIDPQTVLALFEHGYRPSANAIDFLLLHGRDYPEDNKAAAIKSLHTRFDVQPTDVTFSRILKNYSQDDIVALLESLPVPIPPDAWGVYLSKFQGVSCFAFEPAFLKLPYFLLKQTALTIPENAADRLKNARTNSYVIGSVFSDALVSKVERYRAHQTWVFWFQCFAASGISADVVRQICQFVGETKYTRSLYAGVSTSVTKLMPSIWRRRRAAQSDPKPTSEESQAGGASVLDGP